MANNGNFSQRAQGSRIRPINQRPHGVCWNWADSIGSVDCVYLESGTPTVQLFTTGTDSVIEILLFTQDFPVIVRPFTFYATSTTPALANSSWPELPPQLEAQHFALWGNALYTTTQPPVLYESGTYGDTLTDHVSTSGFAMALFLLDRNLKDAQGAAIKPKVQIDLAVNGAVMAGRGRYQDVASSIEPVLLREQDYTDEMRANDNVLDFQAGPLRRHMMICGLFAEKALNQ
jgi:hypothetical protein